MFWTQIDGRVYWTCFLVFFGVVGVWETFRPRVEPIVSAKRRWGSHGVLLLLSAYGSGALFRTSIVVAAAAAEQSRFGLFNKPWAPFAVRCILAFVLLDLLKYVQHRVNHSIPLLWRFHSVHHSDPDFDLTTGARAHPFEVILDRGVYLAVVILMAPPAAAVLAAQLVDLFQSFFSHANAALPPWFEKPLRSFFVTPEMHRIHHSEEMSEQMSNYGDVFPWWDRLFGTYVNDPAAGQQHMKTGLKGFQNARSANLLFMLTTPFRRMAD